MPGVDWRWVEVDLRRRTPVSFFLNWSSSLRASCSLGLGTEAASLESAEPAILGISLIGSFCCWTNAFKTISWFLEAASLTRLLPFIVDTRWSQWEDQPNYSKDLTKNNVKLELASSLAFWRYISIFYILNLATLSSKSSIRSSFCKINNTYIWLRSICGSPLVKCKLMLSFYPI